MKKIEKEAIRRAYLWMINEVARSAAYIELLKNRIKGMEERHPWLNN